MTIKEATYLVGIDPGVKTGLAVYSRMRKSFHFNWNDLHHSRAELYVR
jgi:hypothetical protein